MKFISLVLVTGLLALVCATQVRALEKPPAHVVGIGINGGQSIGAYAYYAVSAMIHVGSGLGLKVQENSNYFYVGPYARFLFLLAHSLYAYVMPQLNLTFGSATFTELEIGAGVQAWVAQHLAIWAGLSLLNIGFEPSFTTFGLLYPRGGVEFNL
jgi:hypothetical protein